jgi:hypothetical protein
MNQQANFNSGRSAGPYRRRVVVVALLSAMLAACITNVEYARRGESLAPREGKALVFTRIRFFDDGAEYLPWGFPSFTDVLSNVDRSRHNWLRPLDRQASSWELHPDTDGSLAIWLPPGDYALCGTEGELSPGIGPPIVVALLRVADAQPAVYAGELSFKTEHREGWSRSGTFGTSSVTTGSMTSATDALEAKYGPLPHPPAMSAWCVGAGSNHLPLPFDAEFASRARQILQNCSSASP